MKFNFDVRGNVIIPSLPLGIGGPINIGSQYYGAKCQLSSTDCQGDYFASTQSGLARWVIHKVNLGRIRQECYGVIDTYVNPIQQFCYRVASIAYVNSGGSPIDRSAKDVCVDKNPTTFTTLTHDGFTHRNCPESEIAGGNVHFYADSRKNLPHPHFCTIYYPDSSLGPEGYAINPQASVTFGRWPETLPDRLKNCPLDPEFLKKLSDALYRRAVNRPGYDGAPYSPIESGDARTGDAKVNDLGGNPGTQTGTKTGTVDLPPAGEGAKTPPAPVPTPSPSSSTGLGENPNVSAPTLSDPPAASSIIDPIFNWLPDLPHITLNVSGAQCPKYNLPFFQQTVVLESHCTLLEDNRAAISVIMLAMCTVTSAIIILRA